MLVKKSAGMLPALYLPIEPATNKEGEERKKVLFSKTPREVYIPNYCLQVPWKLYITKYLTEDGKEKKMRRPPIYHLLDDVITDRRLKDIHWRIEKELAERMGVVSITKSEAVQTYAKELTGNDTFWVMEFVNMDRVDKKTKEKISFARMCLVPEGTTNPKDRIIDALAHLNGVVTDENMGEKRRRTPRGNALEVEDALPAREWKTNPAMIHWKKTWNVILQTALDLISLVEERKRKATLKEERKRKVSA